MFEVYLFLLSKGLDFKAQFFYMFQKNWLSKHMFYFFRTGSMFKAYFFRIFQRNWFPKNLFFFERVQCSKHIFFLHFPKELIFKARFLFFSSGFNVQSLFSPFSEGIGFQSTFFFSNGVNVHSTSSFHIFQRNWFSIHGFYLFRSGSMFKAHLLYICWRIWFQHTSSFYISEGLNFQGTSSFYIS